MPNPFSMKAGKDSEKKPSPFSLKAGLKANGDAPKAPAPRNRSTPKERAAAVRKAEKSKGGNRTPANPSNPWVKTAYDISTQVKELEGQIKDYQKQYDQQLKLQKKAKTSEEIETAFDRGDRLMATIIGLSARRRRLIGGASV